MNENAKCQVFHTQNWIVVKFRSDHGDLIVHKSETLTAHYNLCLHVVQRIVDWDKLT